MDSKPKSPIARFFEMEAAGGILLAMFIPIRSKLDPAISPLKSLEHDLHPVGAFFILRKSLSIDRSRNQSAA